MKEMKLTIEQIRFDLYNKTASSDLIIRKDISRLNLRRLLTLIELERMRNIRSEEMEVARTRLVRSSNDYVDELTRKRRLEELDRAEGHSKRMMEERQKFEDDKLEKKLKFEKKLATEKLQLEKEKLNIDLAVRLEEIRVESERQLRDKRENEDINIRELAEKNSAEKERILMIIRETSAVVMEWIHQLYDNLLVVIGSIIALVGGVFLAKEFAALVREQIGKRLGRPSLVRVSFKMGFWQYWIRYVLKRLRGEKLSESGFSGVILPDVVMSKIQHLCRATRTARYRNSPLMNCMFYGPPGTGKTLVARRFAEYSDLDYAIMSGGDVAPLGGEAVTEIHKLFSWVSQSRRGVLLFIDEAESFLGTRTSGMSEN
jgi:ATPase family AAA domain-containing protein 3A/B